MLKVENLNLSYKKNEQILHDVSLSINSGETVGLIGMNGAGKSTLMRAVSGVVPYQSGNITINNIKQENLTVKQRQEVLFLSADNNLYGEMTVKDNLEILRHFYCAGEEKVTLAVNMLKCQDMLNKKVSELSSGMRQRASIAGCTLGDFRLLLLDEPTNALDIETKKYIIDYIKSLCGKQNGILVTSHNIKDIEELCDRVYILRHGKIVKEATVDSILRESAEKNQKWCISIPEGSDYKSLVESYDKSEYSFDINDTSIKIIVNEKIKQSLLRKIILADIQIISVISMVNSLEDAVLEIIN